MKSKTAAPRAKKKPAASGLKTRPNDASVASFLGGISDERRRKDAFAVLALMKKVTKTEPRMWGGSIVGFGLRRYVYASGGGGDWFLMGFSPRKAALTLYLMSGLESFAALLKSLGSHKAGRGCLYIRDLDDIDRPTLEALFRDSLVRIEKMFGKDTSGA